MHKPLAIVLSAVTVGLLAGCAPEPRFPYTSPLACQATPDELPTSELCRADARCVRVRSPAGERRLVGDGPASCPGVPGCPTEGVVTVGGAGARSATGVPERLLAVDDGDLLFTSTRISAAGLETLVLRAPLDGGAPALLGRAPPLSLTPSRGGTWLHVAGQLVPSRAALAPAPVDLPSLPRADRLAAHAFSVDDRGRVLVPLTGGLFVLEPEGRGDPVLERIGPATITDAVWHRGDVVTASCTPSPSAALIQDEAGSQVREVRCQLARTTGAGPARPFASLNGVRALLDTPDGVLAATTLAVFFVGFDGRLELLYRAPDPQKPQATPTGSAAGLGVVNLSGLPLPLVDLRREQDRVVLDHGGCATQLDLATGHSFLSANRSARVDSGLTTFEIVRGR